MFSIALFQKINEIGLECHFYRCNSELRLTVATHDSFGSDTQLVICRVISRGILLKFQNRRKMSEWNLWQSIESALRLQRVLFVSPFYLDHSTGELKSCWLIKTYSILSTLIIMTIMYISVVYFDYMESLFQIVPNELIWKVLCSYVMMSMIIHFVVNMIITGIELKKQMQFLEKIHEIDQRILVKFSASVDHQKYNRKLSIAVRMFSMFGIIEMITTIMLVNTAGHGNYILIPPTFAYSLQNMTLAAQAYASTNYLFLIERRYRVLISVYHQVHRDYIQYMKTGIRIKCTEDVFSQKLLEIFQLFREITDLIRLFDEISGWIFASQTIKTFMACLAEMYFIFLTSDDELGEYADFFRYGIVYMLCVEILKLFANVIAVHCVYAAVN